MSNTDDKNQNADSDEKMINCLVYDYLKSVNEKFARKFSKEVKIDKNASENGFSSLEDLVQKFQQSHAGLKRKSDESEEKQDVVQPKKKKKDTERKTVFIRNVSKDFDFNAHREKFEKFGKTFGFTNSGKGHGFLTFTSNLEASACVDALNNTKIGDNIVQMNLARGNQGRNEDADTKDCKVFVHGINQETKEDSIKEKFSKYGKVVDCFNPGKGFVFVTYECSDEASAAVEALNGKTVFGNTLSLNISKPKEKEEKKGSKGSKKKKGMKLDLSESSRIFVKNVDVEADMEKVKETFTKFGTVKDAYNPGKGFIFVR